MTDSEHPPSEQKTTVFISDPSVEAERITQALRTAEFHVVDVPLAMLVARVAVQRPRIVILDADAEGALDAVARMRELPDAEGIDVLFCGRPGATLSGAEDALAHEGSGFFPRPVSVPTLLKKIESLASGETPAAEHQPPPDPKPVEVVPRRISTRPPPRPPSHPPSSRPPGSRPPGSRPPPSIVPSLRGPSSQRVAPPSIVSRELAELLSRAEEAVGDASSAANEAMPSPEEEIEAVLPEDVLAALDAPLEDEEEGDEVEGPARVTTSGGRAATTGVREPAQAAARPPSMAPEPLTHDGGTSAHQTQGEPLSVATGAGARTTDGLTTAHRSTRKSEPAPPFADATSAVTMPPRRPSSIPPPTHVQPAFSMQHAQPSPSVLSTTLGSELLVSQGGMIGAPVPAFGQPSSNPSQAQSSGSAPSTFEQVQPPPRPEDPWKSPAGDSSLGTRAAQGAYALGPGDAPRVLAQAIAERQTGALTIETPAARAGANEVRRIVLREGDIVTAASGVETETLLAFLGARGDLPRERVEALAGRLPPYGRHAGAALVAQGVLGQEQLWPVLRAHAEFIMGQAMLAPAGTALLEAEPPGRLKTEPSVFGGAPGAEIFVEVMRRVISSDEAVRRVGGRASVVAEGGRAHLLRECGLGAAEVDAVRTARGQRVDAVMASMPETDVASVLYALWLLGVVDIVQSVLARSERPNLAPDAIDEAAVRERIRARIALVEEGDYFALLGVPHNATGYEVRRAYLDLRRVFEPTRVLTPALLDLAEDVRRIASVLEEAYEILGDNSRRERYRRAIEADAPPL
ncbi:MAG TPA: DUF4388 domain-containing protein [Polyangiaceae bacterium]|jgi:hypothetical protein